MQPRRIEIDPDIRRAASPAGWLYSDPQLYQTLLTRAFVPSWQLVADLDHVRVPGQVYPLTMLEGSLDEPLLLTRDRDDRLHCVSNVCTHRGALVCEHPGVENSLRCRYHGRRFALDGRFQQMPEFDTAENFPSPRDNLAAVPFGLWGRLVFASLRPGRPLEEWLAPVQQRVGWLPLAQMVLDPSRCRDYLVRANWALYCENYLEGFHIPYVHAGLTQQLDFSRYRVELFESSSLQIGVAASDDICFELPSDSPDHGQRVAGYYFFLFPNLMLNFYPWGLSINIVKPLGVDRTRVSFLTYVLDPARLDTGAGAGLDRVEREDEAVVESVQRGMRSRLYPGGRYSPTQERGTHHFHRLLAEALGRED